MTTNRPLAALSHGIVALVIAALVLAGLIPATQARAEDQPNLMSAGDAVVTGFSGFQPSGALMIPGLSPLDQFFINPDGPSAQILSMDLLGEPPHGQLVAPTVRKPIPASEVGQVFPIALMEATVSTAPPAILLGATSMFGLHIVKPDTNGDGVPERLRKGEAGAIWMPGMFADDKGGSPGAVWRVDGQTGDVTLFATIPDNSGPGLGDVVFDKKTRQVFVSDLDTGLIHRLDENGQLIDTFDHGVTGRPAKGLAAVSDDGSKADIENPAFDIEKPETWGLTQVERRVHGMAVHDGRLYYAADHKIWSIGIGSGGFAGDPRWELDVEATKPDTQLSDMLFDKSGRMYVAERAAQRGSYDYSLFAEPEKAEVKRYRLESPDDPATPGRWVPDPEVYAIGLPADHRHSNGGITLGFPYDDKGLRTNACGEFLWTTGERLRAGEFAQGDAQGDPAENADVHGLQGNPISLVRPQNVPPSNSYFTDYDSFFGDAEKAGHMGDVEIWQPCDAKVGEMPPWGPPITEIPPDYPPEFPPPEQPFHTNLELRKYADPRECWRWNGDWICRYTIRIRNTGPQDYFGDLQIRDVFPADPPGLMTQFEPQPPWFCWQPGGSAAETRCWRPDVFLAAGDSLFMTVWARVPADQRRCRLTNLAEIEWAPGGSTWNTDPTDDIDQATAVIPDPDCRDTDEQTDLELRKTFEECSIVDGMAYCGFHITVENKGPGVYDGPIVVTDEMPAGVNFDWASVADWNCLNTVGNTFECTLQPAAISPMSTGDAVHLWVWGAIPIADARQYQCRIPNRAWISDPLGAPSNIDPTNDADEATATLPDELCRDTQSNLRIDKTPINLTCSFDGADFICGYTIRVTNTGPGPYNGPLDVRDTAPAGTTLIMGPSMDAWACGAQVGTTTDCSVPNVGLPGAGSFTEFVVGLRVPRTVARDNQCQITNQADILSPLGAPANIDAADDTSTAFSNIPAEVCNNLPPPPPPPPPPPIEPEESSNLKVDKKVDGACSESNGGVECRWRITVENEGPDNFTGDVVLDELLPLEPTAATWNAPWSCAGTGGAGATCTYPNANIVTGNSIVLELSTTFATDQVRQLGCSLTNSVSLFEPAGGMPTNTDPADDQGVDTANIQHLCRQIQDCPPGYVFDDGQCVPRGPACPTGWTRTPVRGKCCPPGEPWNGRECKQYEPPGIISPPVLPPRDCPYGMREVSSIRAHHLRQEGWTVRRYYGQWCVRPPVRQECPFGYEEVPYSRIDILRARGWTITKAGRGKWCGKEPPHVHCPRPLQPVDASRVPYLKQDGWRLTRLRNGQWCGTPPVRVCRPPLVGKWPDCHKPDGPGHDVCPHHMRPVAAAEAFRLRRQGANVTRLRNGQWCAGDTTHCPRGTHLDDGVCVPDIKHCKPPLIGKWPNCHRPGEGGTKCWNGVVVPPGKACPPEPCGRGFIGYKPNCKPSGGNQAEECKHKGGYWNGKVCVIREVTCPDGSKARSRNQCPPGHVHTCPDGRKVRDPKQCAPNLYTCPNGKKVRDPKLCQSDHVHTCPDGRKVSNPRQCGPQLYTCPNGKKVRDPKLCQSDHVHTCPDGRKVRDPRQCGPQLYTCPNGKKVRDPKQCAPVREPCGPGFVGVKPNCKPIRKPCPPGSIGKYEPNCRPVKPIVRPCPPGTVGPGQPNCKRVPVVKPCPPGTVGPGRPNCKRIAPVKPIQPVKPVKPVKPVVKPCPPGTVGPGRPNCKRIAPVKPVKPHVQPKVKQQPPKVRPQPVKPQFKAKPQVRIPCPPGTVGPGRPNCRPIGKKKQ